ncbi:MAG: response regulator [Methylococcaceae bacterium]|nr:MAG: response regulator [Methylococcaceae bacterium]
MIGNILIVDDEPSALKLLKDILTADGHVVRPFNNGELALRSIYPVAKCAWCMGKAKYFV